MTLRPEPVFSLAAEDSPPTGPTLEDRVAALEATVAELTEIEPSYMARTRIDVFRDTQLRSVRLTHEPTGIQVVAPTRLEAIIKLRKAIVNHAARQYDLQHRERKQERPLP